jgi:hypothetical protein
MRRFPWRPARWCTLGAENALQQIRQRRAHALEKTRNQSLKLISNDLTPNTKIRIVWRLNSRLGGVKRSHGERQLQEISCTNVG